MAFTPTFGDRRVSLCVENSWRWEARCRCGHVGHIAAADLASLFPPATTMHEAGARLRCSACGGQDGELIYMQDHSRSPNANPNAFGLSAHLGEVRKG